MKKTLYSKFEGIIIKKKIPIFMIMDKKKFYIIVYHISKKFFNISRDVWSFTISNNLLLTFLRDIKLSLKKTNSRKVTAL